MELMLSNADKDAISREAQLFRSLDIDNDGHVSLGELEKALTDVGLRADDVRLTESINALHSYREESATLADHRRASLIPESIFCQAIRQNILLIERALQGNVVVPDFTDFSHDIRGIYNATRANRSGNPANYIPQLDLKEPEVDQFGAAFCTIDGQRFSVGESKEFFSVQSTTKPILYALALDEHTPNKVHRHVGHEPSGVSFNELTLNNSNLPHNPMINAGAIMCASLIKLKERQEKQRQSNLSEMDIRGWSGTRLNYVMECWQALAGGEKPRFSSPVYLSERQTADRNFALGYFMREKGAFPEGIDLDDVLDFYFQSCSIEINAEMMSVVAATLANGGICPVTGERVFSPETIQHCLSLMSSCGMYDFSGEFAFKIGLPAKSGVSGAMMIVVPNVMGIATWSPRLDEHGNSVRGIEFSQRLVDSFNFHNYDSVTGITTKKDPRRSHIEQKAEQVNELIWAASKGDLSAIQRHVWRGADLGVADYDLRTPLHLAAAEGQAHVVQFFVDQKTNSDTDVDLNPQDRWGGTPLDDAYIHKHSEIVKLLEENGGLRGHSHHQKVAPSSNDPSTLPMDAAATVELIWAASLGDMQGIRRLVARGIPLDASDYDQRTPLHLAAAEGCMDVVCYLLKQGINSAPRDRWGYTPLDEALRHNQHEVANLLEQEISMDSGVSFIG